MQSYLLELFRLGTVVVASSATSVVVYSATSQEAPPRDPSGSEGRSYESAIPQLTELLSCANPYTKENSGDLTEEMTCAFGVLSFDSERETIVGDAALVPAQDLINAAIRREIETLSVRADHVDAMIDQALAGVPSTQEATDGVLLRASTDDAYRARLVDMICADDRFECD